ncbi:hypothetical protein [Geobacter sp. AOG1]|uniref:hypothetical protein n=1 Tax=Geobacter sp. AOG1 TaxID=1566346 RepID=UPI001CC48024|nr:hypothetical protein [Geobacter sp. AOG1]GFE58875.1 hypothetical protein AOG1_27550 [Geobacter sp. AOG1]
MLSDDVKDQLGLFGTDNEKNDATSASGKRKPALRNVPVEAGIDVQTYSVQVEPEPTSSVQKTTEHIVTPPADEYGASLHHTRTTALKVSRKMKGKPAAKAKPLSGLVPAGDVRLTANIREDLHLKLKIAAAQRRTTIGELIEEMVDKYL